MVEREFVALKRDESSDAHEATNNRQEEPQDQVDHPLNETLVGDVGVIHICNHR